jgi:enamine deaminase RidA (YjgF/YER057c/UK114 family)
MSVMSTNPRARLAELGHELPKVSPPGGAYVPAVRTGTLVYVAGQVPIIDGRLAARGKVGAEVTPEEAYELCVLCALAALAAIDQVAGLENITRIVKVSGFVASAEGFEGQPDVVNGASDLFISVFGEAGRHARTSVGVAELPLGAPVEVEVVAEVAA